ncbi:MAG: pentapeptide repeat-containing protein [Nitrospinae bacterium]|nr:pentapeptide repeat-containing protein [Nitrospinota bacterium]
MERGGQLGWLVRPVSNFLFFYSGPFTIGVLLWRFTDYQDFSITFWHFSCLVFDYYLMKKIRLEFTKGLMRAAKILLTIFICVVMLGAGWFCYAPSEKFVWTMKELRAFYDNAPPAIISVFLPIIVLDPNGDIYLPDEKELKAKAMMVGETDAAKWWKEHGEGLHLEGRSLRGMIARHAQLPKVQMGRHKNPINQDKTPVKASKQDVTRLEGSDFREANLQGANLSEANMQGADLHKTDMQGANLVGAIMQGADLADAQMQGALFCGTSISRVDFKNTPVFYECTEPFLYKNGSTGDWESIRKMGDMIPDKKRHKEFEERINAAEKRDQERMDEKALKETFPNKPEVIRNEVIPELDENKGLTTDSLLAAARGIRRNYEECDSTKIYLEKIDAAFCNSKRLKALCPQQPPTQPQAGTQPAPQSPK